MQNMPVSDSSARTLKACSTAWSSALGFWRNDTLFRSILSGIFTIGGLTAAVKAVGLVKELLVASHFGVSDTIDAFTSAFALWSFVFGVLAGAMPDALLPVYSKAKKMGGGVAADRLAVSASWIYFAKLLIVCAGAYWVAPWVLPWCCLEYSEAKRQTTLELFRNLTPFAIFMGASLHLIMLLQANKRFILAASAPALVPAGAILGMWLGFDSLGIDALVIGTVFGSGAQFLLLYGVFFGRHCGISLAEPGGWWTPEIQLVIHASIPFLLSGVVQLSTSIIDTGMAAWLDPGSVAVRAYAVRATMLGLTLASTAITQAIYPYLADLVAEESWGRLRRMILQFSGLVVAGSIPVIGAIWLGSEWIVRVLFERGEFDSGDTVRVASVLRWSCLQIPFYVLAVLGARVNCAMLASKFMLASAVINVAVNTSLNYIFIRYANMGVEGIAFSTVLTYAVSAATLYLYFFYRTQRSMVAREG